jgi:hypothetical protein
METEQTFCVICAWRENCQKRFLQGKDIQLRCPDFTRDLMIKDSVKRDGEGEDSEDRK